MTKRPPAVTLRLDKQLSELLNEERKYQERTKSAIIRSALRLYFKTRKEGKGIILM